MKKTILAIVLALSLTLSMGAMAFATDSSIGGEVVGGDTPIQVIVPDPDEPLDPDDPYGDKASDFGFTAGVMNFGTIKKSPLARTIRTEVLDQADGGDRTLPLAIWGVDDTVPESKVQYIRGAVGSFVDSSDEVVISAFTLTLTPTERVDSTTWCEGIVHEYTMTTNDISGGGQIATITGGCVFTGDNFKGTLVIPGGAIKKTEPNATAVITWTITDAV